MRLTQKQLDATLQSFRASFLPEDRLWLFGSRVDDHQKGGDIDFYIETNYDDSSKAVEKKIRFLTDLKKSIGEQKIDVVLNILKNNTHQRIYDEAKNTGIQLI
jgi:predicted nucleotidyltransferase